MNRVKTLQVPVVVLALVGALASTPAAALELPDIHVLSGERYPARGLGLNVSSKGAIETELGEKLTVTEGITALFELTELSSLGPMVLSLSGVQEPKHASCSTSGSPAGSVEIPAEYHVVDTSTKPLTAAMLILFKELTVLCNSGKLKIKIRSPIIFKLEQVTSGADTTTFTLVALCSGKGKQQIKEYLNDEGSNTKGVLTANFGLGFETACWTFSEEAAGRELVVDTPEAMLDFLF